MTAPSQQTSTMICYRSGVTLSLFLALLSPGSSVAQGTGPSALPELLKQKRWPEALSAIDEALKTRPKDVELLMNRGAVLSQLGRDAEALKVFAAVAAAQPKLPAAHNNMAVILAATGRYEEARAALNKAIQAQPRYATAHDNLGDLHAHQAAEAYRKALEIDPGLRAAKTKLNLTNDIITLATGVRPSNAGSAAVRQWQGAWTRRDAARYVAAYTDDYRGGTDTAAIWRELAQKRLRERSAIRVDITQLKVDVDGDTAQARFEQAYESDQAGSRMRTRKTLVFQKINGRWLISEERRN